MCIRMKGLKMLQCLRLLTLKQCVSHLDSHLHKISKKDLKSKAIIEQMKQDESGHADQAKESGSRELPEELKLGMSREQLWLPTGPSRETGETTNTVLPGNCLLYTSDAADE